MRTPQRNFVVEYKSARRRLGKLPNAIWGDTDFKALVDEAEADAPHLFGSKTPSEASGQNGEIEAIPQMTVEQADDNETSADQRASAPLTEFAEVSAAKFDSVPTEEELPLPDEKLPEPHSKTGPRRRRKALPKLRVDNKINAFSAAQPAQPGAPFDELASLEEENSLLRLTLARRLQEENSLLRSMLERFGSPAIS